MSQLTIQDEVRRLHHRGDPSTSREAAEKMFKSGKLGKQEQKVYGQILFYEDRIEHLKNYKKNGFTAKDLSNWTGLDYFIIQRRLSGLERKGKIRRTGKKRDGCMLWELGRA